MSGGRPATGAIRDDDHSPDTPITVLVVDEHRLFRAGLARLLSGRSDIEVVAQASCGRLAVALTEELQPDVVLMDLRVDDLEGGAAMRSILERSPSTHVLVLTVLSAAADVAAAVDAGACGFLTKDAPIEDIVAAMHAATRGAPWLSPRAAEAVLGQARHWTAQSPGILSRADQLCARELNVLDLIAHGLDNAQIATVLNVSLQAAESDISSILVKLGTPSTVAAQPDAVRRP